MKKAVIIGLGAIGAVHTAALVQSDFATIAAICDIDTAKLVKTAAEIPYPVRTYTDYKTMLAEVKPESCTSARRISCTSSTSSPA